MMNRNNWISWYEAEVPAAGQAPASDPRTAQAGGTPQPVQPNPTSPGVQPPEPNKEDDVTEDPTDSDIPDESGPSDFEQWRKEFFDLSIKGDTNEMMSSIQNIRNHDLKEASQRKFVEDNLQILLYRQDANILKATKEIRKLIKQDLDRTNPGTTVMQHMTTVLEQEGLLQQNLIKLTGMGGWKGETHRKFIAALLGAVQVGGGNKHREDMIYVDQEYTINVSSRFYTQFGEINLGSWSLKEDDPDRYLTDPEVQRLQEGSPEEKQVLRRRIIMESIAERFKQRAFLIHCVHMDGTIYALGWDMGSSLLSAYKDGKLVVRGQKNESKDAMITDNGEIATLIDYEVLYVHETGETDDNGKPQMTEVPFIERRDSILYLTADIQTIKNASSSMSGMFYREMPYNGNPSDIQVLQRCVPDLVEMLNKRCIGVATPTQPGKTPPPQKMEGGKTTPPPPREEAPPNPKPKQGAPAGKMPPAAG